jgi:glyoxylate reductase
VLTDATADLAMTLLLALTRRVREGEALVRGGGWQGWEPGQLLGRDIAGARVLVVGAGRIGGAFARRVHAFGARVAYHGRSRRPALEEALGARYEPDLDAALGRADVVSLHAPLTPETRHLLDARRLALLPRRAIVINTGRGPLIDEDALVAALRAATCGAQDSTCTSTSRASTRAWRRCRTWCCCRTWAPRRRARAPPWRASPPTPS